MSSASSTFGRPIEGLLEQLSLGPSHKAMASLTEKNLNDPVTSAFGADKVARLSMALTAVSHSNDHYGQMVVYARMNGIIPPASR